MSLQLAAAGAKVVLNYFGSEEKANDAVKEIKKNGGDAIAVKADMLTGRRLGATPRIDWPPIRTSPSSGIRKPAISRNSVVLPQPDGPRMEKKLPRSTDSDSESTAGKSP